MKRAVTFLALLIAIFLLSIDTTFAQCSICTKTASQLGEKPAEALNTGIIYLMLTPFLVVGYVGYRVYKSNKNAGDE